MIVRISGEDQYRLDSSHEGQIGQMDEEVLAAVHDGDEAAFHRTYDALLEFVRANGQPVADDDLEPSDLILPPADISLAEAGREFSGDGLIPD